MTKSLRNAISGLAFAVVAASATAAPAILSMNHFTDVYGPSDTYPVAGSYLHLDTRASSPYLPSQMSAVATYSADPTIVRSLFYYAGPIFAEKNFDRVLTDLTQTGSWNLAVSDPSGTTYGVMPAIADPEFLPLVLNLSVLQDGTTPTIVWDLPDLSAFDVDYIRLRASSASGTQIFTTGNLAASTTSFVMPDGVLQLGQSYEFRVILHDIEGGQLENRSNTFSGLVAIVPAPATLALLGIGLAGLGFSRRRKPQ